MAASVEPNWYTPDSFCVGYFSGQTSQYIVNKLTNQVDIYLPYCVEIFIVNLTSFENYNIEISLGRATTIAHVPKFKKKRLEEEGLSTEAMAFIDFEYA